MERHPNGSGVIKLKAKTLISILLFKGRIPFMEYTEALL